MGIEGNSKITNVYTWGRIRPLKGNLSFEIIPHACAFMLVEKKK